MIVFAVCLCILLKAGSTFSSHKVWISTFLTMFGFNAAQLCGLIDFMLMHDGMDMVISPATICFMLFYGTSQILSLYVFIARIEYTIQESIFKYNQKVIRRLYLLWILLILFTIILLLIVLLDASDTIIFSTYSIWGIFFVSLAVTLSYLFSKKLFEIQKMYVTNSANVNDEIYIIQLKLTILVIIAVISTIFAIIFSVLFVNWVGKHYYLIIVMPRLALIIDSLIGFLCMAFTMNINQHCFDKCCIGCVVCCNFFMGHHLLPNQDSNTMTGSSENRNQMDMSITTNDVTSTQKISGSF